jgi:hypothetical protein
MLSNNANEPQASQLPNPQAAGSAQTPVLDPHSPIETAAGTGTTTDPAGSDSRPPGVYDGGDSLA